MSRQTILLCIFAVLLQWQPWSVVFAHLVPPKGYSLGFTGKTARGSQKYVCSGGSWQTRGSSADVIAPDGSKIGTYWSVYNQKTRVITYFWNIVNTGGGFFESGHAISGLQATPVKSVKVSALAISEYLAIVKVHRGSGDGELVAFVSLTETKRGLPPRKALCLSNGAASSVPFAGNFKFYNQGREPPQVPPSLTPKGMLVQVVFLEGKVTYKFTDGQWRYHAMFAIMAEVAGGNIVGKFGTVDKADRFGSKLVWHFKGPNGFWLSGQRSSKPILMSTEGFPWQLMKITTSGGTVSPLGKFRYALITSTLGGRAPRTAARTNGITLSSSFTGLCSMYA